MADVSIFIYSNHDGDAVRVLAEDLERGWPSARWIAIGGLAFAVAHLVMINLLRNMINIPPRFTLLVVAQPPARTGRPRSMISTGSRNADRSVRGSSG